MSDTKPRPGDEAKEKLNKIHEILNQDEPDDVLIASIREVLYGEPEKEDD